MNNQLQIIDQRQLLGKDFRVYGTLENPLFLAKDVAEWIEHSNSRMMINAVDIDEKVCVNNPYALQGQQEQWFLTEDGFYEVLMQSRKPIAKDFKKKVKEILKDIRKHGMYAKDELLENPDLLLDVINKYKKEREEKRLLLSKIETDRPKVIFADAVSASHTSILVGELAKLLNQNGISIGQNRLFDWLRENGYLIKRKGTDYNMPTQYSMDLGLFEVKETSINHSDGHISISKTPKVTGKGQIYFISKFKSETSMQEIAAVK